MRKDIWNSYLEGKAPREAIWTEYWRFDQTNLSLVYCNDDPDNDFRIYGGRRFVYDIDLEACCNSSQILDRIFQVSVHAWATPECLGCLVMALDDILYPQQNICSFGLNKSYTHEELLKQLEAYPKAPHCQTVKFALAEAPKVNGATTSLKLKLEPMDDESNGQITH
jgi:hypothetical protein